jgi:branched-chain amino acid transport system ATP-binding protein
VTGPILQIEKLGISFGGFKAVDDVSFDVERNSITTVIGPNGAGKSTLFNLISGALRPGSGRVMLDGNDVTGLSPRRMRASGLARSFQITNLFSELSVRENLRIAAQILESKGNALLPVRRSHLAVGRADAMLDRFGLTSKANDLVGSLSHGEQRRLEIAICLVAEPKLLLLDEPTQGMSHGDTEEAKEIIRSLAKEATVLLIEHDVALIMDISHHVIVMQQGRKLAAGEPAAIRANPAVQSAYFGRA